MSFSVFADYCRLNNMDTFGFNRDGCLAITRLMGINYKLKHHKAGMAMHEIYGSLYEAVLPSPRVSDDICSLSSFMQSSILDLPVPKCRVPCGMW